MTCKYCGREITNPNARFCPGCGKPLDSAASAGASGPAAQAGPQKGGARQQPRRQRRSSARPEWDNYQDPNRWVKWLVLVVVLVVVLVTALVIWGITFLNGKSILELLQEDGSRGQLSQSQVVDEAPSSSLPSSLPTARPEPEEEEEEPTERAEASDTQVVFRNVPDDATIRVNGSSVSFEMVGKDAVVQRSSLPDVAQVQVIAPTVSGGWQTAIVWYNYKYGNDMTMGDADDYGQYAVCDSDGVAEPSEKVVDVLTWAYYDGFLRCINDQTLNYMIYSTAYNTSAQSENIFSETNAQNTYDRDDFTAVCDPDSIRYEDGRVIYNAYFSSTRTRRSTGETKQIENHRTIELVYEDGMWKVNRIAFLSDEDFNAGNYAQLP